MCYARQKRFPCLDSRKLIAYWSRERKGGRGCDRYDSAATLAHVAMTKCKWRHPSNCRQKGSRGQLSEWRLQDRLKPNYPFVSSGRSINPTRISVREGKRRERKRERVDRDFSRRSMLIALKPRRLKKSFRNHFRDFYFFLGFLKEVFKGGF